MDNMLTLMVAGISVVAIALMAYLVARIYSRSHTDSENT